MRKPVTISSNTRTMPCFRVTSRTASRKAGFGQQHALQRLDDHRGELVRVALDHRDRRRRFR
jgi:hypothetical protein